MKKKLTKAYIAFGIVSFFWGTTFIATRIGVRHMPGLYLSGLRQFFAGSILTGYFLLKGYRLPDKTTFKKVGISGILLLCIANGMLAWSLQYISGGLAAIIAGLVPLLVTLFSLITGKSFKFTKWMIAGLFAGFAGIVLIFYEYLNDLLNPSFTFGILLAFVSILVWAFGTVYTARNKVSLNIMYAAGWQMLIAGTVTLVICFISGQRTSFSSMPAESLYALLYLVAFGSLLAYSAYIYIVTKLPPTLASVYAYINPIVAVGLGWLILGEKMTPYILIGTLVTLAGVYLVNREFNKQQLGQKLAEEESKKENKTQMSTSPKPGKMATSSLK